VEAIAEFPVTRVGKVDKQALRRMISDTLAREATSESPKVA
jgi:non-ribosomal peptide synthetase component E (peptide arylation enzyme)